MSQQDLSRIKTIGIASVVGETMSFQRVGVTIFTNELTSGSTSDWGLDQAAVDIMARSLGAQYSVSAVEIDRSVRQDGSRLWSPTAGWLRANPALDAYLVMMPVTTGDFIGGSNQSLGGLGIYRRPGWGMQLFAVCNIYLLDARDLHVIAEAPLERVAVPTTGEVLSLRRLSSVQRPYMAVDRSLHRAGGWDEFTDPNRAWMKGQLIQFFEQSVPFTLGNLGLIKSGT